MHLLHLDASLIEVVNKSGSWVYAAIFATIFAETGLVVTPFLPGESLLMASGTLAGAGVLRITILAPLLVLAAFCGDLCNYFIGRFVGRHVLSKPRRYPRPEHVEKAHAFYEHHGAFAVIWARFLPIVRTLVPFLAGATRMDLHRFLVAAAVAAAGWSVLFVGAGYWFGTIPAIKKYLVVAVFIAALASTLPALITAIVRVLRGRRPQG